MFTPQQQAIMDYNNRIEEMRVKELGDSIGYGRLMQLAQQEWEKTAAARGEQAGSAFAYGPCLIMTVPCGCESPSSCDWCCGAGWLTERVRQAKDAS